MPTPQSSSMRLRARLLGLIALAVPVVATAACDQRTAPPPPVEPGAPPLPMPDEAFVKKAIDAEAMLANKPIVADLDPRPGTEVLLVAHRGGKDFQVAVARGNHEVLARTRLGGKILAHANIRFVGEWRSEDLFGDGARVYFLPVETLVLKQAVCGFVAFRYRNDALSLIGEFGSLCWRREAGGKGGDPFALFKVEKNGEEILVQTEEEKGPRTYRWNAAEGAFLSILGPPKKR
jgi:hypothetical protein